MACAADLAAAYDSAAYRYRLGSSGDGFHVSIRTPAIKGSLDRCVILPMAVIKLEDKVEIRNLKVGGVVG